MKHHKKVAYALVTSLFLQTIQPLMIVLISSMLFLFAPTQKAEAAVTPVSTTVPLTFQTYKKHESIPYKYVCSIDNTTEYIIPATNGVIDLNSVSLGDTNATILDKTVKPDGSVVVTIKGNVGTPINLGVSSPSNVIYGFKDSLNELGVPTVSSVVGKNQPIPDSEGAKEKSTHTVDMMTWWLETLADSGDYPRSWVTAIYSEDVNGNNANTPTINLTNPTYLFSDGTKIPLSADRNKTMNQLSDLIGGKIPLNTYENGLLVLRDGVRDAVKEKKTTVYSSSNDFSNMMNPTGKVWTNGDGVNGNYPTETYSESCINTSTIGISSKITFPKEVQSNKNYAQYTRATNFPDGAYVNNYPL